MTARQVAIIGAEKTGKTWLKDALGSVLTLRGNAQVASKYRLPDRIDPQAAGPVQLNPHALLGVLPRPPIQNTNATEAWAISDDTALMNAVHKQMRLPDERLAVIAQAHHDQFDITLIMGLDLPQAPPEQQSDGHAPRHTVDTALRQTLEHYGLAYKVIYGQAHQRLNNALLALGLVGEDALASQIREQSQFAINQGRTMWQCNECSDPGCEHKLFTRLLAQRSDT